MKRTIRVDEIIDLDYRTEKHDYENILESLESDNDYYEKMYKRLSSKKIFSFITEFLIGFFSTISSSTLAILNPSAVFIISSSRSLLTSTTILITNEDISKRANRYSKLRDWINVSALLSEKTLEQLMIDKVIDDEEALELKKIFNLYLETRSDFLKNAQFVNLLLGWTSLQPDCKSKHI